MNRPRNQSDLLSRQEAYTLIRAGGAELINLMQRASALRDAHKGRTVTYSRKVFIPLTNLCRDKCAYCAFARSPGDPMARTLTPDEVLQVARAGAAAGCKEALFSLGDKPDLPWRPTEPTQDANMGRLIKAVNSFGVWVNQS